MGGLEEMKTDHVAMGLWDMGNMRIVGVEVGWGVSGRMRREETRILFSFLFLCCVLDECMALREEIQALKQQVGMRSPRLGQRQN